MGTEETLGRGGVQLLGGRLVAKENSQNRGALGPFKGVIGIGRVWDEGL